MGFVNALGRATVAVLFLSCLSLTNSVETAFAQKKTKADDPQQTKTNAPQVPWLVNCASVTGSTACEAVQRLTIQKTGQLLVSVSVRLPPKAKNAAMMIHLPHGMFLPDGVSIDIDAKAAKNHPVQTCDPNGCYVGLPIDDAMLKALQAGKQMSISFKNLQKKQIQVPISLGGFKEAYQKLG